MARDWIEDASRLIIVGFPKKVLNGGDERSPRAAGHLNSGAPHQLGQIEREQHVFHRSAENRCDFTQRGNYRKEAQPN